MFRGIGPPFGEPISCAPFTTTATTLYQMTALDGLALVELETVTP